ncbi:unnamed protein product [Camellia sinensis]
MVVRALKLLQKARDSFRDKWRVVSIPCGTLQVTFVHRGFDETRRLGLRSETEHVVRSCTKQSGKDSQIKTSYNQLIEAATNSPVITQFLKMETLLDDSLDQKIKLLIERGGTPLTVDLVSTGSRNCNGIEESQGKLLNQAYRVIHMQSTQPENCVQDLHLITPDYFLEVSGAVIHPLSYQQLYRLGLEKGTRKLVNHEERDRVLRAMDGYSYKAAAGGSLSNSLVALARHGSRHVCGPPLNVAVAGSVGSDPLGGFYRRSNLKKVLVSDDDVMLVEIKTALQFIGRPNLRKQGRAAHILLRYEPTYITFSEADNIPIAQGDNQLAALIFPSFKNLRQISLESSDSEHAEEQVAELIAEDSDRSAAKVDEVINLAFEEAGLNYSDPSSTSGRGDAFEDIFLNLETFPKRNAERMTARKKAEAIHSGFVPTESVQPIVVEESAQVVIVKTEKDVERPIIEELLISEDRGEKRSAEGKGGSKDGPVDKRPCLEESAVVAPFIIEPKIKNMPISSEASALKDLAVALSLAAAVSLPADMATFRAKPDLATVALAAQSAFLTIGRIAELGRHQRDAVERIGRLQSEVDGQRSRVEFKAMRAAMESAWAEAEKEKARTTDQLRFDAVERASASEESLKLAKEALAKLEAELEGLKQDKEKVEPKASTAFEAGKSVAFNDHVEEVPKFENRGFRHGWLKALAAAEVTLAMPIPYGQVGVEPLKSDPET